MSFVSDLVVPASFIALEPAPQRSQAKMMLAKSDGSIEHATVSDFPSFLQAGDLLVLNEAKVDPVRLAWQKQVDTKTHELVLLAKKSEGTQRYEAIVAGRNVKIGQAYHLQHGPTFRMLERLTGSLALIEIDASNEDLATYIAAHGKLPIPPYIRKQRGLAGLAQDQAIDQARYQTVFAKRGGAVAAPTAGLHFDGSLMQALAKKHIEIAHVFLQVAWGTFAPLQEKHWQEGTLHKEWVEVSPELAQAVIQAKKEKRRVIAVGTTVLRSLAWWHAQGANPEGITGWCDIFLRPPWRPSVVDGLFTNFHMPSSSLFVLVSAFLGSQEKLESMYRLAMEKDYRFYSFGDAMFVSL